MIRKYKDITFRNSSLKLIELCNEIIAEYQAQGLTLTLRQLFYQHVTANTIPNSEKAYKALGALVSNARLAGLMDWDAIEDRGRRPHMQSEFDSIDDLMDAAMRSYRLPRWRGQPYYVELWVEKDALSGVLAPLAREFHVTMCVNRGYSSSSAMHESANRFIANCEDGREPVLFYLGDLDPSGEDMVRDIEERMKMFGVETIEVRKLALTHAQVLKHNPPPNPAKFKDPRSPGYIAKYGRSSWEVDALNPKTLAKIIRTEFATCVDKRLMDAVIAQENQDKEMIEDALARIRDQR